jgi:hypothetical protein
VYEILNEEGRSSDRKHGYRQTTTTIGLEPHHGALNGISTRLHLARTGFKSWSGKDGLTAAQKPNFPPFSAQERLRNG